jgi:hypothetical protein
MLRTVAIATAALLFFQAPARADSSSVFSAAYVTTSDVVKMAEAGFDVRTAGFGTSQTVLRAGLIVGAAEDTRFRDAKKPAQAEMQASASERLRTVAAIQPGWVR